MSAFVVIPEERWSVIEKRLENLERAVCQLTDKLGVTGDTKNTTVNGKRNIAKVLGCSAATVSEMCRCNALGVLLWKTNGKRSAVMHLDNVDKAKERFKVWQSMDDIIKDSFMRITNASYIEEYWRSRYNL